MECDVISKIMPSGLNVGMIRLNGEKCHQKCHETCQWKVKCQISQFQCPLTKSWAHGEAPIEQLKNSTWYSDCNSAASGSHNSEKALLVRDGYHEHSARRILLGCNWWTIGSSAQVMVENQVLHNEHLGADKHSDQSTHRHCMAQWFQRWVLTHIRAWCENVTEL